MKPIKVRIKNFQSIEDVSIEINGFVIIVGKSNIGKSSIVRAISSAILNKPVVGMVRKGAPFSSVEIQSEDWAFTWEKGERGVNRYIIGEKVYDKIGQKQLDEIRDLGFGSVKIGQDEIQPWVASQFFPIFLLDKSGPQVTDFISEVSRLSVLQDAVILSARGKRNSTDEINNKSEEINRLKEREQKVVGIDKLSSVVEDLEEQASSLEEYERRMILADDLLQKIDGSNSKIKKIDKCSSINIPEEDIKEKIDRMELMKEGLTSLERAAKRVISINRVTNIIVPIPIDEFDEYERATKYSWISSGIQSIKKISDVGKISVPSIDEISDDIKSIQKASKMSSELNSVKKSIDSIKNIPIPIFEDEDVKNYESAVKILATLENAIVDCTSLSKIKEKLDKELENINEEISQIPLCPTCNRPGTVHGHATGLASSSGGSGFLP